jgi:hypothetical protein
VSDHEEKVLLVSAARIERPDLDARARDAEASGDIVGMIAAWREMEQHARTVGPE